MSVILGGENFGFIFASSGTRGFFGEGYQHHEYIKKLIPDFSFKGSTFVAKTGTVPVRMNPEKGEGNLLLNPQTLMPVKLFNDCIRMNPITRETHNAVGLSNPGLRFLFETGRWQNFGEPMFISAMVVGKTKEERLAEYKQIALIVEPHVSDFLAPVALEINITCPNAGCNLSELEGELREGLSPFRDINIHVGVKVTVFTDTSLIDGLYCDSFISFVSVTNTIPWARLGELGIKKGKSPLAKYNGGGYTGPKILPHSVDWTRKMRSLNDEIQIITGGGVTKPEDLYYIKAAGANAAAFASMAMTRPQNVQPTIKLAKELFGG